MALVTHAANPKDQPLTAKQWSAIRAFTTVAKQDWTEAARLAGYKQPLEAGRHLRQQPNIKEAVRRYFEDGIMEPDEWAWRLARIARADIGLLGDINEETGEFKLNLEKARKNGDLWLLGEMRYTKYGPTIRLQSKLEALTIIGRHLGLINRSLSSNGDDDQAPSEDDRIKLVEMLESAIPQVLEQARAARAARGTKALPIDVTTDEHIDDES